MLNEDLADQAEVFHNSLYIGTSHVTELVSTYYIAGYGVDTVEKIEYDMSEWNINFENEKGDSVVPIWSATLGDRTPNRTFYAEDVGHTWLVKDPALIDFIAQLVVGNTSIPSNSNIHNNMLPVS